MINAVFLSQEILDENMFWHILKYASEDRLERFKCSIDKRKGAAIVLGEYLLKHLLSEVSNLPIQKIEIKKINGKPVCPQYSKYYLSLSHSGKIIFAAISDSPVSCDVQEMKDISLKKIECFFSKKDCKCILEKPIPNALTFYKLWTHRECAIKLFGIKVNKELNFCEDNLIFQNSNIYFHSFKAKRNYIFTIASLNFNNLKLLECKELYLSKIHDKCKSGYIGE